MIHNLNYTTGLMDNLLQWAKSQMQTEGAIIQSMDTAKITGDTIRLLRTQAEAKQVSITAHCPDGLLVQADNNMIELVIRNLLSNAIKFTPEKGAVVIGIKEYDNHAEFYVTDNGRGIGAEALQKINGNNYFSTNGTAQEPGTGLGLMLCKEFLLKNNSHLCIQSMPGQGSTFSFALQKTCYR
jgi:signal transduction histidine kinase